MRIHQFLHQTVFKLDFFYARIPSHHKFPTPKTFYSPSHEGPVTRTFYPTPDTFAPKTFTQKPFYTRKPRIACRATPFLTSCLKCKFWTAWYVSGCPGFWSLICCLNCSETLIFNVPTTTSVLRACWTFETMAKCKFEQQSCILFIYLSIYLSIYSINIYIYISVLCRLWQAWVHMFRLYFRCCHFKCH